MSPEYIPRLNPQLMGEILNAAKENEQRKRERSQKQAEAIQNVFATVNDFYKTKEDKAKNAMKMIQAQKEYDQKLGIEKLEAEMKAKSQFEAFTPKTPTQRDVMFATGRGIGGIPSEADIRAALSPGIPEGFTQASAELAKLTGGAFVKPREKEFAPGKTDILVSPEQYNSTLIAYQDKPDILKKLVTTTQPGMKFMDYVKSVQNATKEIGGGIGGGTGAGILTDDTNQLMAEKYLATGQLEGLGMGAASMRGEILNKASKIAKSAGNDGQALAAQKAGYEADKGALIKLTNIKEQTLSFEKQARKNIELADKMAQKLDAQGNTVFNKWWINRVKGQYAGDKDVENFQLALTAATKEYAKVISGGAGSVQALSDTANKEIQDLINKGQSYDAFREKMDIMILEMRNRETSYNEQLDEINLRLNPSKGKKKQQKPAQTPSTGKAIRKISL